MKLRILTFLLVGLAVGPAGAEEKKSLTKQKDRISYALGNYIGDYWKRQGLQTNDVEWDLVVKGFQDALSSAKPFLNEPEIREALRMLSSDIRLRYEAKQKQLGEKNKKEGDALLARNKAKPGVRTLPSGLQYQMVTEGSGPSPTTNDTVVVNYRGTLIDGTEFDSSYKNNQPATFRVTEVVKGWTEALQLMKPGAKWQLVVPPKLGYGERGFMEVGPNATLLLEVELISIKPPENAENGGLPPTTSDIIKVPSAEALKKGAKIEIIKPDQIEKEKEKK